MANVLSPLRKDGRVDHIPNIYQGDPRCTFLSFCGLLCNRRIEAKLPTIWTDEKQSREEAERRERLAERRAEEKESEERRCRCAKR